jgi:hypothetical protein
MTPWMHLAVHRPGHNGRDRCAMSRAFASLKVHRPVSSAGFQIPAAGPFAGDTALKSQNRRANPTTLERPMFPPVDQTRRRFLSVAVGGTAALSLSSARAAARAVDPIYAAIEQHRAAAIVWDAAVDVWAKFPDGPEPMSIERRIERERINDGWRDARDAMDDAGVDLINTSPTTLADIARALNYIREQTQEDGTYMPSGLRFADDTEGEYPVAWIETFLDAIEHAASELDRAGKAVQA